MVGPLHRIQKKLELAARWRRFRMLRLALGVWDALVFRFYLPRARPGTLVRVRPRRLLAPVFLRSQSSDPDVFEQVILEDEYRSLQTLNDVGLVIDCGANVGYASVWFLSHYPRCHVIAVEPDARNFALLQRNLAPYGARATSVYAGVWPRATSLVCETGRYRDGREWATQVRPARPGERGAIDAVTIDALLGSSPYERISLLKMDIEGAEAEIFRETPHWIDKVGALAIELHDDSPFGNASDVFFKAIAAQSFTITRSGELTICRRLPSLA